MKIQNEFTTPTNTNFKYKICKQGKADTMVLVGSHFIFMNDLMC